MSLTPTGPLTVPPMTLRDMLAASTTFQSLVRAATSAAALAYIYTWGRMNPVPTRPFAVVSLEDYTPQTLSGGTRDWTQPTGRLEVQLEIPGVWHGIVDSAAGSPRASRLETACKERAFLSQR